MTQEVTPKDKQATNPLVYEAKEVEAMLRLGKNAVNALLRSGRLRSIRYGRKYLIPASAITDFLNGEEN